MTASSTLRISGTQRNAPTSTRWTAHRALKLESATWSNERRSGQPTAARAACPQGPLIGQHRRHFAASSRIHLVLLGHRLSGSTTTHCSGQAPGSLQSNDWFQAGNKESNVAVLLRAELAHGHRSPESAHPNANVNRSGPATDFLRTSPACAQRVPVSNSKHSRPEVADNDPVRTNRG